MAPPTRSNTSDIAQVIYNEGWGQLIEGYPEFALTERVKQLDPSRLVIATSGWIDHGAGDFSVSAPPAWKIRLLLTDAGQSSLRQPAMWNSLLFPAVTSL